MTDLDGTEGTLVLDESEIASIAGEMARAYAGMVRYYREAYGLTVEEAEKKTRELIESAGDDGALTGPSDQVSWYQLMELMEREPRKAVAAWERVKRAAREEQVGTGPRRPYTECMVAPGIGRDCWRSGRRSERNGSRAKA